MTPKPLRLLPCLSLLACGGPAAEAPNETTPVSETTASTPPSFGDDLSFLRQHTEVVLLGSAGGAQVAVAPAYQGRVMTSTAAGDAGASFGWINRGAIASGERAPHMNVFGGEDRFWLGPEGGQYALYFPPGAPFDLEHWQVPEPIDWGGWDLTARSDTEVSFGKAMELQNYAGTTLKLRVERTVRMLDPAAVAAALGALPEGVSLVGYESVNTITNTGEAAWRRETGLPSIWILCMYTPSPRTTIVIPFVPGAEAELGPIVNDAYFGKVPADRLVIGDGVLYFRGDGRMRGKIGIPRPRAKPVAGSYDAAGRVLTLVRYDLPEGATDYVNSMWEMQERPYGGDVVNSYNDGPPEPGKPPLGPFYELETSSPAAALAPGERLTHVHRTFHLTGDEAALDAVARSQLGVGLAEINGAFAP